MCIVVSYVPTIATIQRTIICHFNRPPFMVAAPTIIIIRQLKRKKKTTTTHNMDDIISRGLRAAQ